MSIGGKGRTGSQGYHEHALMAWLQTYMVSLQSEKLQNSIYNLSVVHFRLKCISLGGLSGPYPA